MSQGSPTPTCQLLWRASLAGVGVCNILVSAAFFHPAHARQLIRSCQASFTCICACVSHRPCVGPRVCQPVPVPVCAPAAQIGPLKGGPGGGNGSTGILENSAVLGVLRAATDKVRCQTVNQGIESEAVGFVSMRALVGAAVLGLL